jgi:hypothetical protein
LRHQLVAFALADREQLHTRANNAAAIDLSRRGELFGISRLAVGIGANLDDDGGIGRAQREIQQLAPAGQLMKGSQGNHYAARAA